VVVPCLLSGTAPAAASPFRGPLSSKFGTYKTVQARLWPSLEPFLGKGLNLSGGVPGGRWGGRACLLLGTPPAAASLLWGVGFRVQGSGYVSGCRVLGLTWRKDRGLEVEEVRVDPPPPRRARI